MWHEFENSRTNQILWWSISHIRHYLTVETALNKHPVSINITFCSHMGKCYNILLFVHDVRIYPRILNTRFRISCNPSNINTSYYATRIERTKPFSWLRQFFYEKLNMVWRFRPATDTSMHVVLKKHGFFRDF